MIFLNIVNDEIWTFLAKTDRPLIIYGMGNGADKIIDVLKQIGKAPYGVMASDDFVRGQTFHGYTVRKLSYFEERIKEPIILVSFGSQRQDVMNHIMNISKRHTVFAPDVPVYGDNIFNMEFFNAHKKELETVYNFLADNKSKHTFENVINFKLSGKIEYLTEVFSDKADVFENIITLGESESCLDAGAYTGDTVMEILSYTKGKYKHITALEPDKKTFEKLKKNIGGMPDVRLFQMGIWNDDCDLSFNNSLGRGSSIKKDGEQPLSVTKIDTLFKRQVLSYLKLDVEGSELMALLGGVNVIKRDKPKINMAVYHRSEDIYTLPLLIKEIEPRYNIYLRQHPHIPAWDLNIYCV